jgi:hypothetical protein
MNNNYCYEKLNISLSADNRLLKEYRNLGCGHVDVAGGFYSKSDTFKQCTVPSEYFDNEPIKQIIDKYGLTPKLFLIEAGHVYNWHRDAFRNMTINMVLGDDPDYLVLFANNYPDTESPIDVKKFMYQETTRIVYDPRALYVFNTQIPHISINYSKVDRYILTISNFQNTFVKYADQSSYFRFVNELKEQKFIG